MPTIKDMCEQRTKLITDAQALVLGEKVTVEQRAQANKMVADVEILEADINTAQRLEKFELESRSSVKPPRGAPAAGSIKLDIWQTASGKTENWFSLIFRYRSF